MKFADNDSRICKERAHGLSNVLRFPKEFYCKNKSFSILLLIYLIALASVYSIQTVTRARVFPAWGLYSYFDYVNRVQAAPFIDFRSGYPPLGIMVYYPFFLFAHSEVGFQLSFVLVNVAALSISMIFIYLTLCSLYSKSKATKSVALIMVLPSIAVFSFATVDPLSLLFMTAVMYCMIVRQNAFLTGLFLGFGFMTKIYPILLLIPAFAFFRSKSGVSKLLYATFISTFIVSLPFLSTEPFMYATTFLHHSVRGPSDTVWALSEGFYGHTGILHPDFDQFLYFWQFVNVYEPSVNDHAFYLWRTPWMPNVLFIGQAASLVGCYFLSRKWADKRAVLKISAISILLFLFFNKLYSPQFGVYILPFVIMSLDRFGHMVIFGLSLDAIHNVQGLVWSHNFFDYHFPLFISEIFARSTVFLIVIALLIYELIRRKSSIAK